MARNGKVSHDARASQPARAHRALATPTDLTPAEVAAVAGAVNPLISDALALYVKIKNYHWHVSGPRFRDLHLLLDEQAEQVLESIDPLAERLRKIGATTLRSLGHARTLSGINDDDDDFVSPQRMVERLLADHVRVTARLRGAIEVCERSRDKATADALLEVIDQCERRTWFLHEIAQGGSVR